MTTYGKFGALLLGATVFLATPVIGVAADDSDDIVVSSSGPLQQWQQKTSARLDRALRNVSTMNRDTDNAIVQIAFTAGPDGRPADPQVVHNDGSWMEGRIATIAVNRLNNLDEVPVARPGQAKFLANIIFADDYASLKKLRARLEKMERARLASKGERSTYIALGY